uniref:NADH-ubiquinone oxidoreductase chain 5 n=1 Tax=Euphaedusa planostriata TaxID=2798995 RepID=A0A7T7D6S8_9EUPU|nr:NADH dehydrogenase subunit 5 [Euphaedusa planostriata]QQL04599.1 NADH dehydrogenase subunit 5 [Euphaedusa planostriata]
MLLGLFTCFYFLFLSSYLGGEIKQILTLNIMSCSGGWELSYSLIFDWVGLSASTMVCLISFCVFSFAKNYMSEDQNYYRFGWVLLSFVVSMLMLIMSGSLFAILIGWDGLGISSFALIIYYQNKVSLESGFLTLMSNRIGDIFLIMSFGFMVGASNIFYGISSMEFYPILVLYILAGMTKSAQYPFSAWLPAAMAAPTPVSALVHSSTLVTAGVYLIVRINLSMTFTQEFLSSLLLMGSVTCLLGGLCAMVENDLKKLIALSTLSQLGIMMYSLGLNMPYLALFHLYSHAFFKALLFLVAGLILLSSYGVQDLRLLGSALTNMPLLFVFFNISNLCLIAAPFMSSFYSKHMILEISVSSNTNSFSFFIMLLATLVTSIYVFRSILILGWVKSLGIILSHKTPLSFYWPLCILAMMGISLGPLLRYSSLSLLEHTTLPYFWTIVLSLMPLLGLFITMNLKGPKNSTTLSNLLYLWPVSYNFKYYLTSISAYILLLDKGWMEPQGSLVMKSSILSSMLEKSYNWPNLNSFTFSSSITSLSIIMYIWFLNF